REGGCGGVGGGRGGAVWDPRTGGHRTRGRSRLTGTAPSPSGGVHAERIGELVAQLRAGDRAAAARRGSAVVPERGRPSAAATLQLLRDAAREERSVWLGFVDTHGTRRQHVVLPRSVGGGVLHGIDTGSGEPAEFPLHRITSVAL